MKPAPFEYVRAETIDHVLDLLVEYGSEAKIIAGGQSLVPMMNLRLARPAILIDISRTPGLSGIRIDNDATRIGSTTRHSAVLASAEARHATPVVVAGLRHVAHPAIRNRGTVGGSIAHADPAAELPAIAMALGADFVVRGPTGQRSVSSESFFRGYFETALADDELLTEIHIPARKPGERAEFVEVARRHGDFALVGAVTVLKQESGRVEQVRIVVFGVAATPVRAEEAEAALLGTTLNDDEVCSAAATAAAALAPRGDIHASPQYRRSVAEVLVRRALQACRNGASA